MPDEEPEEVARKHWSSLAAMLNCSEGKIRGYKNELLTSGVIFYMNLGTPPRKTLMYFPSRVRNWAGRKGAAGEII